MKGLHDYLNQVCLMRFWFTLESFEELAGIASKDPVGTSRQVISWGGLYPLWVAQ
jgi:hypothetical protein